MQQRRQQREAAVQDTPRHGGRHDRYGGGGGGYGGQLGLRAPGQQQQEWGEEAGEEADEYDLEDSFLVNGGFFDGLPLPPLLLLLLRCDGIGGAKSS